MAGAYQVPTVTKPRGFHPENWPLDENHRTTDPTRDGDGMLNVHSGIGTCLSASCRSKENRRCVMQVPGGSPNAAFASP